MEVRSVKSDSQTLMAQPKKDQESGRPILYYVYLVTPKALGARPNPAILWRCHPQVLRGQWRRAEWQLLDKPTNWRPLSTLTPLICSSHIALLNSALVYSS
jgi:hypothetical protein